MADGYVEFFGFREHPFSLSPDPRFFYPSKGHQKILSRLLSGLEHEKGISVVTGEAGLGKTTLCQLIPGKVGLAVRSALITSPPPTAIALLQGVNQAFGSKGNDDSRAILLEELTGFLSGLFFKSQTALLIIDEAHFLTKDVLDQIQYLARPESRKKWPLRIVLVGSPELQAKLEDPGLEILREEVGLRCKLTPLGKSEVRAYIQTRIRLAGRKDGIRFAVKGAEAIFRYSRGRFRSVNRVADRVLLAASMADQKVVTEALVKSVIEKLVHEPEPSPERPRPMLQRVSTERRIDETSRIPPRYVLLPTVVFSVLASLALWTLFKGNNLESRELPGPSASVIESVATPDPRSSGTLQPVQPEPSPFDADGVFRVQDVSESKAGAYLTLLKLFIVPSPQEDWKARRPEEILGWMSDRGIRSYAISLKLEDALVLNYPLVFPVRENGSEHYQVLKKIEGGDAFLLDPLTGKKRIPLDQLARKWNGKATLVGPEIEGVSFPLLPREGHPDGSIRKIQELLKDQGLFAGQTDGVWGANTRRAIRFFQQREGLSENGAVGPETYLLLAKKINSDLPQLR